MSAKRRLKNTQGSQISLQHEMSIRSASPGSRATSALSKKSASLDDVDGINYAPKINASTGAEELHNAQTVVSPDHKILKNQPAGCWKTFYRGVRGMGLNFICIYFREDLFTKY